MADPSLEEVSALMREATSILFVTGAGVSADSGLPTYRGISGLYEGRETDEGLPIEVALSGAMFARRPDISWRHIAEIERACRGAKPSAGHMAIAAVEARVPRTWVLTQNVDGLHRDAGSRNVIEIHGTVRRLICTGCPGERDVVDYAALPIPPTCRACAAIERPNVVLFGEMLPIPAVEVYARELERGFDLVFSVGTTSVFPYIAEPVVAARRMGLPVVEINPGESEVSEIVSHRVRARAADVLPTIVRLAFGG